MFRLVLFSFSLFILVYVSFSQAPRDTIKRLTPEQYKQDFVVLQHALKQTYPSLYRFRNKQVMDKLLDSCYYSINKNTGPTSFYATIKYVLAAIEDGHLSCRPSKALIESFGKQKYFPLSLVFLNDGVYNYCNHPIIPRGAKIRAINNIPIEQIRAKLYSFIISDGKINTSKDWELNNTFWFYYYLVYGRQATFMVQYKLSGGVLKNVSLIPELRNNFTCSSYEFSQQTGLLDLSYPDSDVAIMTIKTFSRQMLTEAKEDFITFLDSSFSDIKKKGIHKLIIDLRGNGGGADIYGARLYSYLTNKPFEYYKELETKDRKLTIKEHPNLGPQKPNNIYYKGQVFFLINGLTFSAATEVCAIAKSSGRGKFIGEETGGTYYGNTSGSFVDTLLPSTGITVSLSTTKYIMAVRDVKLKDRGIIPNHIIIPTIKDIAENKDVVLEMAIKQAVSK
jgi:hypothetical protein